MLRSSRRPSIQPYEMNTATCSSAARDLGFDSINVDLIYGLPYQTAARLPTPSIRSLASRRIASLFSATSRALVKKRAKVPSPRISRRHEKFEIFRTGLLKFLEAGYLYIAWTISQGPRRACGLATKPHPAQKIFRLHTKPAPTSNGMDHGHQAAFKTPTRRIIAKSLPGKKLSRSAASPPCAVINFRTKTACRRTVISRLRVIPS